MKIAFTGFFKDESGYGESARRLLGALHEVGAEVAPGMVLSNGAAEISSEEMPLELQGFLEHPGFLAEAPDVHLMYVAANEFPILRVPGQRSAGLTCWETDLLHVAYVAGCADLDCVIVPSRLNAEVFRNAGIEAVAVPFPTAQPGGDGIEAAPVGDEAFVFYTVLTWQERKNPRGLLTAYLTAFSGFDNVELVVKVNGPRFLKSRIEQEITELITAINRPNPPKVRLIVDTWPAERIWALHRRGDCFVLLTRGESFTLPALDALTVGNQIIITEWGGHRDYLAERDGVLFVEARLTPVVQSYPYFTGDQAWADPDILQAADMMRAAFKGGRTSKRTHDLSSLAPAVVGQQLVEALRGK